MSRIYIISSELGDAYNDIHKNTYENKVYNLILVKKHYKIYAILHQLQLYPTDLTNIICQYTDDIILLKCIIRKFYIFFELIFSILPPNYDMQFHIILCFKKETSVYAYYLDYIASDCIDILNEEYYFRTVHDHTIDHLEMINTYLDAINRSNNKIKISKTLCKFSDRAIIKCDYTNNNLYCICPDNNLYGMSILDHRQFQNIIVIIKCIINRIIRDLNTKYSFLYTKKID